MQWEDGIIKNWLSMIRMDKGKSGVKIVLHRRRF